MKFQKKPVVIEAVQFRAGDPWPEGVTVDASGDPVIETLEGPLHVSDRDWIITGVKGEKYPCKPDIFTATYDRAPENFYDRLQIERNELAARLSGLQAFLSKPTADASHRHLDLLRQQDRFMQGYLDTLDQRLDDLTKEL